MAGSRKRQRALVEAIAESAVVDDDVQAEKPAKKTAKKTAKKAAKKRTRKSTKKTAKKATKRKRKPAKKSGRKPAKKAAKKPAKKPAKKAAKGKKQAGKASGSRGKPPEASAGPRKTKATSARGSHLRVAPDERRCHAILTVSGEEPRRCTRWTVGIDDDHYDDYCAGHSNTDRATQSRMKGGDRLRGAAERRSEAAKLPTLFEEVVNTQDDVQRERLNLVRHLLQSGNKIPASIGATTLQALKDMSNHIERYGSHQGQEGGASIMRLLPGATIVEANFDEDRVFTKEDYEAIMEGMLQDERDGIEPARDVAEQAKRYLGRTVRPRDRSRYYDQGGPDDAA